MILSLDAYEFLRENGIVGEDGEIRSSVDKFRGLSALMLKWASALGLTPAAMEKLKQEKPADDLAAKFANAEDAETSDAD